MDKYDRLRLLCILYMENISVSFVFHTKQNDTFQSHLSSSPSYKTKCYILCLEGTSIDYTSIDNIALFNPPPKLITSYVASIHLSQHRTVRNTSQRYTTNDSQTNEEDLFLTIHKIFNQFYVYLILNINYLKSIYVSRYF